MYENVDLTKFRDDMDLQRVLKIINWTALGLRKSRSARSFPMKMSPWSTFGNGMSILTSEALFL